MNKIFSLFLSFLFIGCAARGPATGTFQAEGLKIGTVEASIDETSIEPYPVEVFSKLKGKEDLIFKVTNLLKQRNLYDPNSNVKMNFRVVDFRLRHGATRYFTGFFSGSDRIGANVEVTRDGKVLLSQLIEGSGGNGNPFNISRESRGTALFHYVADRAVGMLARDQINR